MSVPAVETRDLTKHYGPTVGLEGLDLTVERGEVFGFLGPNGAGKSTTIRLLLDLIRPTRGEARLFGRSPALPSTRARVGYLPGELSLDERLAGSAMLAFLDRLRPADAPPADEGLRGSLCERLGLSDADLAKPIRDDSRGTKQKIGLVAALQHEPDLLVLDEPTTGLDPLVREAVFDLLLEAGRSGRTVFHSSHVLSEVDRTCTRVGVLRDGQLVALEQMDELRKRLVRRMEVQFRQPVRGEEFRLPGVQLLQQDGHRVVLRVEGGLDPLLALLSRHRVRNFTFPEPDLEDAFVRFYTGVEAEQDRP